LEIAKPVFVSTTALQDVNYWTFRKVRPPPKSRKKLRRDKGPETLQKFDIGEWQISRELLGTSGLKEGAAGAVEQSSVRNGSRQRKDVISRNDGKERTPILRLAIYIL
jgi:hypothetical protein